MQLKHVPFSCLVAVSRDAQDYVAKVLVYNARPCEGVRVDASTVVIMKTTNM